MSVMTHMTMSSELRVVALSQSNWCEWIIIGAMTGAGSIKYQPKILWIKRIMERAKRHNIPIYMKSNLKKVWKSKLIQEFPCTK